MFEGDTCPRVADTDQSRVVTSTHQQTGLDTDRHSFVPSQLANDIEFDLPSNYLPQREKSFERVLHQHNLLIEQYHKSVEEQSKSAGDAQSMVACSEEQRMQLVT